MEDDVFMISRETMAELMVEADPTLYRKYISYGKKGEALLTVRLPEEHTNFYDKLVGDLEAQGFEINPYNPCVSNKTAEGEQMTITWHVDNLKILYVDRKVVSDTIYGWNLSMARCTVPAGSGMNT